MSGRAHYYCAGSLDAEALLSIFVASLRAVGYAAAPRVRRRMLARNVLLCGGASMRLR